MGLGEVGRSGAGRGGDMCIVLNGGALRPRTLRAVDTSRSHAKPETVGSVGNNVGRQRDRVVDNVALLGVVEFLDGVNGGRIQISRVKITTICQKNEWQVFLSVGLVTFEVSVSILYVLI